MISRWENPWHGKATLWAVSATCLLAAIAMMMDMRTDADDVEDPLAPVHEHPAHGTRFWFEVIESFNAKYQGDTPGHVGRGGGLSLQPNVALGDPVYHRIGSIDKNVGVVTGAVWERVRGSLTVEFRPHEDHRIAVGDEVWVDLNPAEHGASATAAGGPPSGEVR